MSGLFSMEGRYNRAKYFWTLLGISVITKVLSLALGLVVGSSGGDANTASALSLFISIPAVVIIAFQVVKRLHDLGRPGSHYWLLLIPFYNIYLLLVLLFQKGNDGENKYGPDPLAEKYSTDNIAKPASNEDQKLSGKAGELQNIIEENLTLLRYLCTSGVFNRDKMAAYISLAEQQVGKPFPPSQKEKMLNANASIFPEIQTDGT